MSIVSTESDIVDLLLEIPNQPGWSRRNLGQFQIWFRAWGGWAAPLGRNKVASIEPKFGITEKQFAMVRETVKKSKWAFEQSKQYKREQIPSEEETVPVVLLDNSSYELRAKESHSEINLSREVGSRVLNPLYVPKGFKEVKQNYIMIPIPSGSNAELLRVHLGHELTHYYNQAPLSSHLVPLWKPFDEATAVFMEDPIAGSGGARDWAPQWKMGGQSSLLTGDWEEGYKTSVLLEYLSQKEVGGESIVAEIWNRYDPEKHPFEFADQILRERSKNSNTAVTLNTAMRDYGEKSYVAGDPRMVGVPPTMRDIFNVEPVGRHVAQNVDFRNKGTTGFTTAFVAQSFSSYAMKLIIPPDTEVGVRLTTSNRRLFELLSRRIWEIGGDWKRGTKLADESTELRDGCSRTLMIEPCEREREALLCLVMLHQVWDQRPKKAPKPVEITVFKA